MYQTTKLGYYFASRWERAHSSIVNSFVIFTHISNYSKNSIWRKNEKEIWIFANNVPIIIESVHSNF